MSPLERLLAEGIPDGTFGDAQPARPRSAEPRRWTPAEQAAHLRELAEALGVPHLRTVRGAAA